MRAHNIRMWEGIALTYDETWSFSGNFYYVNCDYDLPSEDYATL